MLNSFDVFQTIFEKKSLYFFTSLYCKVNSPIDEIKVNYFELSVSVGECDLNRRALEHGIESGSAEAGRCSGLDGNVVKDVERLLKERVD